MSSNKRRLTRPERLQIECATFIDPRTLQRAYRDPTSVRWSTMARIERAASELGLPTPWDCQELDP